MRDIRLAIAKLAAGGIVAGPHAGKSIADVQNVIPARELDPAIHAELKKLDGAHALLNEVSMNRLRISAVRIDGEPTHPHRFAAQFSVERPVVGVRFLAREHQVIVPV